MKDKDLIRIINKSKEGPTLKVGHNTIKYTWDEFNSMYDIVNLVYAKMKPEAKDDYKAKYDALKVDYDKILSELNQFKEKYQVQLEKNNKLMEKLKNKFNLK